VGGARITANRSGPAPADDAVEPGAGDGDVLTVDAVALNPLDLSIARGVFYGGHPPLPYIPGCEAVARRADGTRAYVFGGGRGVARDGFLAQHVGVAPELQAPVPEAVDSATAAAAGIAGIAAWVPVAWRADVRADDRVLVLGATGTVGSIAVQAARARGATVVGAARRPRGDVIALDAVGDAFGADGFTVCIDPLWAAAAPGARIVHVGQSAGPEAPLRSADVRGKQLQVLGHSNFGLTAEERNRAYAELLGEIAAGRITLEIERFPLERVAEAWACQADSRKAVVEL
jgi:NADPH2:quinone reductase